MITSHSWCIVNLTYPRSVPFIVPLDNTPLCFIELFFWKLYPHQNSSLWIWVLKKDDLTVRWNISTGILMPCWTNSLFTRYFRHSTELRISHLKCQYIDRFFKYHNCSRKTLQFFMITIWPIPTPLCSQILESLSKWIDQGEEYWSENLMWFKCSHCHVQWLLLLNEPYQL